MKKGKNELQRFIVGLLMLVGGLYSFSSRVYISTGFYTFRFGSFESGGLIVVPFIAGIIWLFLDTKSIIAKFLTAFGLFIIIASIIMGTKFVFVRTNLYDYLIMLVLIFGGLGLLASVLLAKPKK